MSPRFKIDARFYVLLIVIAPLAFHQLLWHTGSPYFFTRDDNLNYFLPLIQTHTQMTLSMEIPRMIWGLGAGWDPFNSGQAGLFYPFFHIARVLSLLFSVPFALLEISLLLHQIILGVLVFRWSPGKPLNKFLLALALIFLPGPFLLGMNWHNYGIAHVWWVAVLLLLHKQVRTNAFFRAPPQKLLLAFLILLFYLAAHPQMFVWGVFFWVFGFLLLAPSEQWRPLFFLLGLCLLPTLPSLLYLREIALQSSTLIDRFNNPNEISDLAQPLHLPLVGSVLGNAFSWLRMHFWDVAPIETQAPGIYFQPMIWVCLFVSVAKRRWLLLALVIVTLALLGNETFSWVSLFMQGPFKGFHWTFKLVIFTAPFFLLLAFYEFQSTQPRRLTWGLAGITVCSMAICFQGRHFDLMIETQNQHHLGANKILTAANQCLEEAKIPTQARLAFVGDYKKNQQQPAALMPMIGNGMILLHRNALHLYEPMDTNTTAMGRLSLSGRYGYKIKSGDFMENKRKHLNAFHYLGVTHFFSLDKKLFAPDTPTFCETAENQNIYFQALENSRKGQYPHTETGEKITFSDGGNLKVESQKENAPVLNTVHPVAWDKSASHWHGSPNPINPIWGTAIALLMFLMAFLFWRIS